jgi:hypothetical protein
MWVYVDDIIFVSLIVPAAHRLVSALSADFDVKDLGKLHFFLRLPTLINVILTLTQQKYSLISSVTQVC